MTQPGPTIVPLSPQQEAQPIDPDPGVEIGPGEAAPWRASLYETHAEGATPVQALQRLHARLQAQSERSEAWGGKPRPYRGGWVVEGGRIWGGHWLSADASILEQRRAELLPALLAISPLTPNDWPEVQAHYARAARWLWTPAAPLRAMRTATHRGAQGELTGAAEAALVRSVYLPAAVAWACVVVAGGSWLAWVALRVPLKAALLAAGAALLLGIGAGMAQDWRQRRPRSGRKRDGIAIRS